MATMKQVQQLIEMGLLSKDKIEEYRIMVEDERKTAKELADLGWEDYKREWVKRQAKRIRKIEMLRKKNDRSTN